MPPLAFIHSTCLLCVPIALRSGDTFLTKTDGLSAHKTYLLVWTVDKKFYQLAINTIKKISPAERQGFGV